MIASGDDAYAHFARVRAAVAASQYPARVEYAVVVSGVEGSKTQSDRYRAAYAPQSGALRVQIVTDRENANPPHPHGVNLSLSMTLGWGHGGNTETTSTKNLTPSKAVEDLLGVPFLKPDYSFGIARVSEQPHQEPAPQSSGLRTIAVVVSPQHDYTVEIAGSETIGNIQTEHLVLRPLHDPNRFRLRDLWVDPVTWLPLRAVIARNFTVAPEDTVPWSIDFRTVDGGLYIARETALATLHEPHGRFVSQASVVFDYAPAAGDAPSRGGAPPIPLDEGGFRKLEE
ncbi:MAG TPA: hypothetical protein VGP41_02225, partial [Candidatus Lustribacter sp.]|nr:hypothetical protein [Candidatus Lustribacter sp.]